MYNDAIKSGNTSRNQLNDMKGSVHHDNREHDPHSGQ